MSDGDWDDFVTKLSHVKSAREESDLAAQFGWESGDEGHDINLRSEVCKLHFVVADVRLATGEQNH